MGLLEGRGYIEAGMFFSFLVLRQTKMKRLVLHFIVSHCYLVLLEPRNYVPYIEFQTLGFIPVIIIFAKQLILSIYLFFHCAVNSIILS